MTTDTVDNTNAFARLCLGLLQLKSVSSPSQLVKDLRWHWLLAAPLKAFRPPGLASAAARPICDPNYKDVMYLGHKRRLTAKVSGEIPQPTLWSGELLSNSSLKVCPGMCSTTVVWACPDSLTCVSHWEHELNCPPVHTCCPLTHQARKSVY